LINQQNRVFGLVVG